MSDDLAQLKARLLEAALVHVPAAGWSERALALALADLGLDRAAGLRAYPRGAAGLLEHFIDEADRRMVEALEARDLGAAPVRERVAAGVRLRLEQLAPTREATRKAVAAQALPSQAGGALGRLYRTVDAIWRAAGDDATDFNFYTKRALLAWVYGATLLFWLDDRSEGCEDTWAFLERRIDEVMAVHKARGRFDQARHRLAPRALRAARRRASRGPSA